MAKKEMSGNRKKKSLQIARVRLLPGTGRIVVNKRNSKITLDLKFLRTRLRDTKSLEQLESTM